MPSRHPTPQMLTAFMAGDISPGSALAVSVHAESCPECRAELGYTGADRQTRPGSPVRLVKPTVRPPNPHPELDSGSRALGALRRSGWRWTSPGVRLAKLDDAAGLAEAVFLLKLSADRRLPRAMWRNVAHLVVVEGRLRAGSETLSKGDFLEPGPARRDAPAADGAGCICLVVTSGELPASLAGRILRPFRGGSA